MIPEVGTTCRFTFISKFSSLDGVYRVRAEMTFKDALISEIDFVENLYVPAGMQTSDFNSDIDGYLSDRIGILESVLDNTVVYYVPESIFLKVPDPTVREYFRLMLAVDLGVQANTQAIFPLLDQIKDLVQSSLGTTEPLQIVTNSEDKIYLVDDEYQELVSLREANITKLVPLSVQLREARRDLTDMAAKLAKYEALIIQSQSGDS